MDYHGLPTPRTTLATSYVCVLVWCKSCRHQAQADLPKLIDAGRKRRAAHPAAVPLLEPPQ